MAWDVVYEATIVLSQSVALLNPFAESLQHSHCFTFVRRKMDALQPKRRKQVHPFESES